MNFIFISPNYPSHYFQFTKRLKDRGVNVLGIGDASWDSLSSDCRDSLCDYICVSQLSDYDSVYRAVAQFISRYGRISHIESQNEYWLELDARLRQDFNITSGPWPSDIERMTHKSLMKQAYAAASVKTARWTLPQNLDQAIAFAEEVGYPVILKPDRGVGAANTWKIRDRAQLTDIFNNSFGIQFIEEEFIPGHIVTFDGITDSNCEILVALSSNQPIPPLEVVTNQTESISHCESVPLDLRKAGEAVLKEFGVRNRFFHFEFFRIDRSKKGLGRKGDIIGLEVNMRVPGGWIPDQMNYATDSDVYTIWADSIIYDRSFMDCNFRHYVTHIGRRDSIAYTHSNDEIRAHLGNHIVMEIDAPELAIPEIGNHVFLIKADTLEERDALVNFVIEKA